LEYKNIPHLFFNAFDEFILPEQTHRLDWSNRFMSPYSKDLIYTEWCARQGYQEITPGWCHYESSAHVQWADVMYRHIKNHNIL
jgi:hypothetical protein